ncbi:hypothetical protein GGTG_04756 [Gaeumannomyces tritici R3-111a-1]|uniref:Uncharacterized protein n=1 Tax=Gaeumannomyces tritici (strain R3-111a-1) TaxID=644352 RepID=J3NU07_GAET3|nr:hypothetical protein GGTG_04756 [Gaeumannomyces tritici R3-111a-1]EJT79672.1 hypothetical protein GGTG_04756 [Gaeumannomyces tritici R3-111a-1]
MGFWQAGAPDRCQSLANWMCTPLPTWPPGGWGAEALARGVRVPPAPLPRVDLNEHDARAVPRVVPVPAALVVFWTLHRAVWLPHHAPPELCRVRPDHPLLVLANGLWMLPVTPHCLVPKSSWPTLREPEWLFRGVEVKARMASSKREALWIAVRAGTG